MTCERCSADLDSNTTVMLVVPDEREGTQQTFNLCSLNCSAAYAAWLSFKADAEASGVLTWLAAYPDGWPQRIISDAEVERLKDLGPFPKIGWMPPTDTTDT